MFYQPSKIWCRNQDITEMKRKRKEKLQALVYLNKNEISVFKVLCLPPLGSGDILFFPGRPSVCLSVRLSVCLSVTNRVRSIT